MEKIKSKVIDTTIGRYEYDSITVELEGIVTEICFTKDAEVNKYAGKDIELTKKNDGSYTVAEITKK